MTQINGFRGGKPGSLSCGRGGLGIGHSDWIVQFGPANIDLAQSLRIPDRMANLTSSERLLACILVMTLAR